MSIYICSCKTTTSFFEKYHTNGNNIPAIYSIIIISFILLSNFTKTIIIAFIQSFYNDTMLFITFNYFTYIFIFINNYIIFLYNKHTHLF